MFHVFHSKSITFMLFRFSAAGHLRGFPTWRQKLFLWGISGPSLLEFIFIPLIAAKYSVIF